jgi:hypothetical protein
MKRFQWAVGLFALLFLGMPTFAKDGMMVIDAGRNGATIPLFVLSHPAADTTLVLLPGAGGATGKIMDGQPGSNNFLSRSRELFQAQGFNVIVMYRASDLKDLDVDYRITKPHMNEIERVVKFAKQEFKMPVWLIGTSRGTVSATAAAIAFGPSTISGPVLTSSVTDARKNGVGTQAIDTIKMPVLIVHHHNDQCRICVPSETAKLIALLTSAPIKKFIEIEGGYDPTGDACGARHWHGYIHYEAETVKIITDWIKHPTNGTM